MSKGFRTKPIINHHKSSKPSLYAIFKPLSIMVLLVVIVGLGRWMLTYAMPHIKLVTSNVLKSTIGFVGSTVGTNVEEDEMGQISVLLVGVGGEGHRGTYNTDTMLVASYSPQTEAVTFMSIPRDLYVNIGTGRNGRINAYLSSELRDQDLNGALASLTAKVSSMINVPINHYALVDFKGFEKMIDTLGGIKVDVPKKIVDTTYPLDEFRTTTLVIEAGEQVMDGSMALKYARSRHSTSDFDRSLRQQQIIQGALKQLLAGGGLLKLNQLNDDFQQAVTTDLSMSQLVGLSKYLNRINHYYSFALQSGCPDYFKLIQPGCLLYAPDRDLFAGAAILLPDGATASRISQYDKIQKFAYYTIYQQQFLVEGARIVLWNAIDKDQILKGQNANGVTSVIATNLVKNGFTVVGIGNSNIKSLSSQILRVGTGNFDVTSDLLKDFAPATYIASPTLDVFSGTIFSGNNEVDFSATGVDLILVIGNDYLGFEEK